VHGSFLTPFRHRRRSSRVVRISAGVGWPSQEVDHHPNCRITLHIAPTGSWVNIGGDRLRDHHPPSDPPGHVHLGRGPIGAIESFIDAWNDRCEPFVWSKTAEQIIPHATGGHSTSLARH
jgi:hypothetical protein